MNEVYFVGLLILLWMIGFMIVECRIKNVFKKVDKMKVTKNYGVSPIPMRAMAIGEMMEIMETIEGREDIIGHIVVKSSIGWIDLNNPNITWTTQIGSSIRGRILKDGESVTLTQENSF